MVLINWLFKKSDSSRSVISSSNAQKTPRSQPVAPSSIPPSIPYQPAADPTQRSEERKLRRQARREQLYSAIRQSMACAGVLSASFKFKVLSLDQRGDQFLVMMDVHPSLGFQEQKLVDSEALVMQTAKSQFNILVTAVYWRIDTKAEVGEFKHAGFESRPAPLAAGAAAPLAAGAAAAIAVAVAPAAAPTPAVKKPATHRFEPIDDDEVSAFKRAMATPTAPLNPSQTYMPNAGPNVAGNAAGYAAANAGAHAEANVGHSAAALQNAAKTRNGPRSFTLITGFEDTEMPESAALPGLSATQYGDLN